MGKLTRSCLDAIGDTRRHAAGVTDIDAYRDGKPAASTAEDRDAARDAGTGANGAGTGLSADTIDAGPHDGTLHAISFWLRPR